MISSLRFWTVVLLLLGAILLIERRGNLDKVPASEPLAQFPATVGSLLGTDIPFDPGTLQVLGNGVFLSRVYQPSSVTGAGHSPDSAAPVNLFIGYFPTQRSGQSIHSPQNCLPGAGWSFDSSGTVDVPTDTKPMQVGEYLISNGSSKAEVLYWYQSHGRAIANDYKAKFYMLMDAVRMGRTDAALIRIITMVQPGETRGVARARALTFATTIAPDLPHFIPN